MESISELQSIKTTADAKRINPKQINAGTKTAGHIGKAVKQSTNS